MITEAMSNARELRLAYVMRGLDQLDSERAEFMTGWKDRRLKLENELKDICNAIITGQTSLIDAMEVGHPEPMSKENGKGEWKRRTTMLSPAVMFIEQAIDALKSVPEAVLKDEVRELNTLGDKRAQQAGATGLTDDFHAGYVLGLQTARVILAGSPLLALAHIKPDDVL